MRKLLFGGTDVQAWTANVGLLMIRCIAGLALALSHGINKLPPSEGFVARVGSLGFPVPGFFAYVAAVAEFFGGLFVVAGFLTRPSAFLILLTMLVIVIVRHGADPFGGSKELATLYGGVALMLSFVGSGRYGIDEYLRGGSRG